jgi:hypothetical protein
VPKYEAPVPRKLTPDDRKKIESADGCEVKPNGFGCGGFKESDSPLIYVTWVYVRAGTRELAVARLAELLDVDIDPGHLAVVLPPPKSG